MKVNTNSAVGRSSIHSSNRIGRDQRIERGRIERKSESRESEFKSTKPSKQFTGNRKQKDIEKQSHISLRETTNKKKKTQ
jgi:hypothetical protein